ncbi:hypothetical protein RBH29_05895 [Herbivorax sp. ANBcel31]|uniref:hypothetical protein n=1 Tax=Herbivorax sp. ANBcel31 TaxID=3069754 RepID=UPI0027B6D36F|nr:hypothetical protein [Herbivorax sp. ANBcel31]MDQ2085971.1 hypothetical protein [Herbivorax sp. ANBcel31]
MFFYNRHLYSQRPKIEHKQSNNKETVDIPNLKKVILESLEYLSDNMDQLKETINKLNEKIDNIEAKQNFLENQIDPENLSEDRISQSDLLNIKSELDLLKKEKNNYQNNDHYLEPNNQPVMPGSGFASITTEYLKNLKDK